MTSSPVDAIQAIQAMLAPAVAISAVGLLLLSMSNRYSAIINRIRLLNDEKRKYLRMIADHRELAYTDNVRFMSVRNQTDELMVAVVDLSVGKDPSQMIVLVNPVVVDSRGKIHDEEGCLSLPDLVEVVERPEEVCIRAQDETGAPREVVGRNLLGRALCHEIDHLDRHVFLDRLSSLKRGLLLRKVAKRRREGSW